MKLTLRIFILLTFALNAQLNANEWNKLFDYSQYQNAKISPDGEHLAVAMNHENKTILLFLNRKTMSAVGSTKLAGNYEVGNYHWVNNERVVIDAVKRVPWREQLQSYGELFAVNYDGSRPKLIYGYQAGEMQTGSRIKKKKSILGWGSIIDTLPEDEQHILIESTPMSDTGERLSSVLLLNVYNGIIKKELEKSPIPFSHFLTDAVGKIKAVVGTDKNADRQLYLRNNGQWEKVPDGIVSNDVRLVSISPSGEYLYTLDNPNQDLMGIFKLNMKDFTYKNVYTDKKVDITDAELTADGRQAYALRIDDGYPTYLVINKQLDEAKTFKDLLQSFPFSKVNITSRSSDGNYYVVMVSSDIDPGSLYLFDKEKNALSLLFKFKPETKGFEFAQSEPINLTTKDGTAINGYFTQAKSSSKGSLAPVVVMVHGGPHGRRDYWTFSSAIQYLALNGYSVLQINYRGSGGYGEKFEIDGHRVWGTSIQQDIFEGYQWLVNNKKAEKGNACIMGASFGAYSAVQSATLYPDTYKCVIANAGVYDLELILEENSSKAAKSFWLDALGEDKDKLKMFSPVNYAERIQAPLLLAHGEDDEIAPFEHIESLRKALDKANKPYQWYVVDKEGHGFYKPENQKAYMRKVLSFLDQHLKQPTKT